VGDRLFEGGADHRHARAVGPVEGLRAAAGLEHLAAEALAEAALADEAEVLGRDAAVGGEAQALVLLVVQEDPGRGQAEARDQLVEGRLEDGLDVLLAVQAGRDGREHGQLALAPGNRLLEPPCLRAGAAGGLRFRQFLRHHGPS
jgi:hypothetical protein